LLAPLLYTAEKEERGRDSFLTGGVLVSHFFGAELLKHVGEPFRIPPRRQSSLPALSAQQKSHPSKGADF